MSFNYGEKAYDRVKKAIKFITAVCVIYTLAGWGILKLMPEFFIRIFNSDPELLEKGVPALIFIFSGSVLWLCSLPARVYLWHLEKQKSHFFFTASKSDHSSSTDDPAPLCERPGNRRCILGRADFQSGRRMCMFFYHAGNGSAGTE